MKMTNDGCVFWLDRLDVGHFCMLLFWRVEFSRGEESRATFRGRQVIGATFLKANFMLLIVTFTVTVQG